MLTLLAVLALGLSNPCLPTSGDPEIEAFTAAAGEAKRRIVADGGALWGRALHGEWLGFRRVGGTTCGYATARPADGSFSPHRAGTGDTLWVGMLPATVNPANTSTRFAGRRWAGIVLPLGRDSVNRVRLLVHELVHTLQPAGDDTAGAFMPRPAANEGGRGSDQLEGPEGRTLLRLELRALAAALASGDGRRSRAALRDALVFRKVRYAAATVEEQQRQRGLDVSEGLADYTGLRLATTAADARARVRREIAAADSAAADPASTYGYTRGFPYLTGPAYALLLDEHAPGWRARVLAAADRADLQSEIATHVPPGPTDSASLRAAGGRYDGEAVERGEAMRWARVDAARRAMHVRFVAGPALRLRPGALNVTFDPNGQTALGDAGTVMRGFVWKGAEGAELRAPEGALVSADWTEVRVPLGSVPAPSTATGPIELAGEGWTLRLPAGWTVTRVGSDLVATPGR